MQKASTTLQLLYFIFSSFTISADHLKQILKTSPRYLALLDQAGIRTVKDFLQTFPRTHEDRSHIKPIHALDCDGSIESIKAQVTHKKLIPTRGTKKLYEITLQDEEGAEAVISLFNNQRAYKSYEVGQWYIITGKVVYEYRKIIFRHPDATKTTAPQSDDNSPIRQSQSPFAKLEQSIYRLTKKTHQKIEADNLIFLQFIQLQLQEQGYSTQPHTDRAFLIHLPATTDTPSESILFAGKANHLNLNEAYKAIQHYCLNHNLTGALLYYSDEHERLKLLSYYPHNQSTEELIYTHTTSSRNTDRLYPIYSEILGIAPSWIARNMRKALPAIPQYFKEYLPDAFLQQYGLLDVQSTIRAIHFPDSPQALALAQERIYFDRLLRIQLHALLTRDQYSNTHTHQQS